MGNNFIEEDVFDPKSASEDRTIYFKTNGDDNNDGTTNATAVKTIGQALTLANAITPPPSISLAVNVISNSGDIFVENITVPDFINIFAPAVILFSTIATPALTAGSSSKVNFSTIVNVDANGIGVDANNVSDFRLTVNTINVVGTSGKGLINRGTSNSNLYEITTILGGISCIENTSTDQFANIFDIDVLNISQISGTVFIQNGVSPSLFVGKTSIDISGGTCLDSQLGLIQGNFNNINVDTGTSILTSGGNINIIVCETDGAITVGSGDTLDIWNLNHVGGVITETGTINGYINGTYFGNAASQNIFTSDGTLTGNRILNTAGNTLNFTSGVGANGDLILQLESDTDDAVEMALPRIEFIMDGGVNHSIVGHQDVDGLVIANSTVSAEGILFKTGNVAGASNAVQRASINGNGIFTVNDNIQQGAAAFSASTNTATQGFKALYRVTGTASPVIFEISSADISKGTTVHPWFFEIKDESGNAGTNSITITTQGSETIDGQTSIDIVVDFGSVSLYANGSNLFIRSTS